MSFINESFQYLKKEYNNRKDSRIEHYPLMGNPIYFVGVLLFYLYFSYFLGPQLMKNRQPFQLKKTIIGYNLFQIVWNLFVGLFGLYWTYWQSDFSFWCQPCTYGTTPREMYVVIATYIYFMAKIIDVLDTVFFIMQKKFSHVSILHVYHHSTMLWASYWAVKFLPGGHSSMLGIINSFVHSIMYSYYLMTAIWVEKRTIWWKMHLTQLQMIQMLFVSIHYIQGLLWDCGYPKLIFILGFVEGLIIFTMFANFYYHNYYVRNKENKIK